MLKERLNMISAINFMGKYESSVRPKVYKNQNVTYPKAETAPVEDSFEREEKVNVETSSKNVKNNKNAKKPHNRIAALMLASAITGGAATGGALYAVDKATPAAKADYLLNLAVTYSAQLDTNPYNQLTANAIANKQEAQSQYGTLITDGTKSYIVLDEADKHTSGEIKKAFDIAENVEIDDSVDVIEVPTYRINQKNNIDLMGYINPIELVENLSNQTGILPKDYSSVSEWVSALNIAVDSQKFPHDLDKDEVRDCLISNMPTIEKTYFG